MHNVYRVAVGVYPQLSVMIIRFFSYISLKWKKIEDNCEVKYLDYQQTMSSKTYTEIQHNRCQRFIFDNKYQQ